MKLCMDRANIKANPMGSWSRTVHRMRMFTKKGTNTLDQQDHGNQKGTNPLDQQDHGKLKANKCMEHVLIHKECHAVVCNFSIEAIA